MSEPTGNLVHLPTSPQLLDVERARDILAAARTIDDCSEILNRTEALAAYLRKSKATVEIQNDATEIAIMARRRIGQLTLEIERSKPPGRGKGRVEGSRTSLFAELGVTAREVGRCEALAGATEDTIAKHVAAVRARSEKLTTTGPIAAISHAVDYDSDEFYTPDEYVATIRRVLGGTIDLDPASCEFAQKTVRAKRWFGKAEDGLSKPWRGCVWLNPPYRQPACAHFCDKFIEESTAGRMTKGVILLNASTDTGWFHRLAAHFPAVFTKGRINFMLEDGTIAKGNRVGQVFFVHGVGSREVGTLFATIGTCMRTG